MGAIQKPMKFMYGNGVRVVELEHAPDGWDDQSVTWARNKRYYGLFRSFSIPLKFIKDGAYLLREDLYTYGFDIEANLSVYRYDPIGDTYYLAFSGVFDFSTFNDTETHVEITVEDRGLAKMVKDNEDVEYEFLPAVPGTFEDVDVEYSLLPALSFNGNTFRAITPYNMLLWLIDKITDGQVYNGTYAVKSTLLTSSHDISNKFVITMGYFIRNNSTTGTPNYNYFIKTTLKDFFASLNAITPIGLGVETIAGKETLVLESRDYFYDGTDTLTTLDSVADMQCQIYKETNFNVVENGYPEKDYDDSAYTLTEFALEINYKSPIPISKSTYDIKSKYRCDGNGIKQILDNSQTTPWDEDGSDEDLFWVEITDFVRKTPFAVASCKMAYGIIRQSAAPTHGYYCWNAYLSPKRCLLRHQEWIEDANYKVYDAALERTSGGKNTSYDETQATQTSSEWVNEYTDIILSPSGTFNTKYHHPFEITIEAAYPQNMISLVSDNPRGLIYFEYKGNYYSGFVSKIEMKMDGRGSKTIKLLPSKKNDMNKLIRL